MTLEVKSPISYSKAEYEGCATWSIPRGVSSHHVLLWAFGDAYFRREKVRHATLLFCAKSANVQGNRRGKRRGYMRCRSIEDVVGEVMRLINEEKSVYPEAGAEFFFRGESKNHKSECDGDALSSEFQSLLDREGLVDYERRLFEEAMRLNVASFEKDKTMVDRIARMQHYQLPTRFADVSTNALLSTHFACNANPNRDGFIRVMKVAEHKMKSFTSDVIIAISHLPLVNAQEINPSEIKGLGKLTYEIKNNRPGFISEEDWPEIGADLRHEIQQV
jgi:hypothetical protein